ncbi:coiled-coil domain-containing protein, partial [Amycolatopsis cihanbeyliensis]
AERAAASHAEAAAAQATRDEATSTAATQRAGAAQLTERLEEIRSEIRGHVRDGLLTEGTEVTTAAQRARTEAETVAKEAAAGEAELEGLGEELAEAQSAAQAARHRVSTARDRSERAAAELDKAHRRTDSLAAEPRLAELLGGESVQPETDAPALQTRLREARAEAERERMALRMAEQVDERALAALGSGGLLPAPAEVQSVLDVLEGAGVPAWSGWRYLSTLDRAERGRALERFPHLVGGVLLNDPAALPRAEAALAEAKLLPSVLLAVGTTAAVRAEDGAGPAGLEFLVPPNPAMYDEEAADAEREAIAARHARRQKQLESLSAAIEADAALEWKLTTWREDYPAGALGRLAEEAEDAAGELTEAGVAERRASTSAEELTAKRARLREDVPRRRAAAR